MLEQKSTNTINTIKTGNNIKKTNQSTMQNSYIKSTQTQYVDLNTNQNKSKYAYTRPNKYTRPNIYTRPNTKKTNKKYTKEEFYKNFSKLKDGDYYVENGFKHSKSSDNHVKMTRMNNSSTKPNTKTNINTKTNLNTKTKPNTNTNPKVRKNDCKKWSTICHKPIIYIYPKEETNVLIKLGNPELLTTTYPKYKNEWNVTAKPNGDLIDKLGRTYYGLYWEGISHIQNNFDEGFVVNKENLIEFFEEKLAILGLTEREANEFIIYWLPELEANEYNLIRFRSMEKINEEMPLEINPTPDTIIRVLMEYKPIDKKVKIKEQKLNEQKREGFTIVEWGGSLIK